MLGHREKIRYDRQMKLDGVGPEGQLKLKNASVVVIGAGGLGCPALQYLAAAGVGHLGIVDYDVVDESNLQRQVLYTTGDLGKNKAEAAKLHLEKLNPLIHIESMCLKLTAENALSTLETFDLILDCTDNYATRYLVNDVSILLDKPLIYGAIYKFEGQVSVFNHDGGPSYRCLFPTPPMGLTGNCSEMGVLGVLPGVIGTHQATEALKLILEIGRPLSGRLMLYNALRVEYTHIQISRNGALIQEVKDARDQFHERDYAEYCNGMRASVREIDLEQFQEHLSNGSMRVLDVRESWEDPIIEGGLVMKIPVSRIESALDEISKTEDIIVVCQHGIRSKEVVEYLQSHHQYENLINLQGGLTPYE